MTIPEFTDGFFTISTKSGFLPVRDPLAVLPSDYQRVQDVIDSLPGLIRDHQVQAAIAGLPLMEESTYEHDDIFLIGALYRAYCFMSSAFLLEPAFQTYQGTGEYGEGRARLPIQLAQPLTRLASRLDVFPFLEYSYGYSLGNYVRIDPSRGLDVDNLRMACSFTGGSDETGFIMDHVDINQHTPSMIRWASALLRDYDVSALRGLRDTIHAMNASRKKMWDVSRWRRYNDFRVFIMGIQGNTGIFPNGVIYEPEETPRSYRGQSGSQDTIIPFLDTLLRVCEFYPDNDLTRYLMDMRRYRPRPFRELLEWTETHTAGILERLTDTPEKCVALFETYREMYHFRNGHWQFVQKYIMANTRYPVATGGTPITTWLPNQIDATLSAGSHVLNRLDHLDPSRAHATLHDEHYRRVDLLKKQMDLLSRRDYESDSLFALNHEPDSDTNISL